MQELKAADTEFPKAAIEKAGYGAAWHGQKSWNGVAILARDAEPIVTRTELPGDSNDAQARYIEAAVRGVVVTSIYAPNGNPQPGPKFDYKVAWLKRLVAHARDLYRAGVPVVLAGDYNVVPTERDIYPTKSYTKNALVQPESGALFRKILDQAGPTRSAPSIQTFRCTHSGTTCGIAGRATRVFGSITCSSARHGNLTGVSATAAEAAAKSLELILEMIPGARRVGVLGNADDPF